VYPYPHVDEVMPLMAEGKILPYLDIPFQHAHPEILKSMRRPGNQVKVLERIRSWREQVPDIAIRSTFIVGYPGETEEHFQFLLDWLSEAQIDRLGCFKFEPVDGAAANDLPGHVPEAVKQERWERLMAHQQAISEKRLAAKVGRQMDVLVDEVDEDGAIARSYADAPEIDGNVFVTDGQNLKPGDMVPVTIVEASEYDLFAVQNTA
ncbi:MAG TPA: 30S ribosomal protein S12 methylthiotransferase RimO, partial [Rhodospirillaceae bacterium]|nr:30S ribosomal protein S12 methylthiotransferase RimO [Rhodospirillaceae bacterium]